MPQKQMPNWQRSSDTRLATYWPATQSQDANEAIRKALIGAGALAAGIAVASATNDPTLAQNAGKLTTQLSQQVGNAIAVYPYSRDRELEADHIGMFLMADAKYDPKSAVEFWERAMSDPSFSSSLAFFSTHPPAERRLEKLRSFLPEATRRFKGENRQSLSVSGADSFDVSGALAESSPSNFAAVDEAWKVRARKAVLYAKPSDRATMLGEFSRGTEIRGEIQQNGWLRIRSPDAGYLRTIDLQKLP